MRASDLLPEVLDEWLREAMDGKDLDSKRARVLLNHYACVVKQRDLVEVEVRRLRGLLRECAASTYGGWCVDEVEREG